MLPPTDIKTFQAKLDTLAAQVNLYIAKMNEMLAEIEVLKKRLL